MQGSAQIVRSPTYLDELVPPRRDDDRVLGVGREPHARNPLSMALIRNGVLAVAERVPELDGPVARSRDDLPVVGREGDRKNIALVADEPPRRGTRRQLPEAERLVPGGRQGVSSVRRDDLPDPPSAKHAPLSVCDSHATYAVRDNMRVAVE